MSRSKSNAAGMIGALVGAFLMAALVGPFFVAGRALWAELRERKYGGVRKSNELIGAEEARRLQAFELSLQAFDARVEGLYARGYALGCFRRSDGFFDARNTEAKSLNGEIDATLRHRANAAAAHAGMASQIDGRIDQWRQRRVHVVGARAGVVGYLGVFGVLTGSRLAQADQLSMTSLMFGIGADGGERMVASAIASFAAVGAMWVGGQIAAASLR